MTPTLKSLISSCNADTEQSVYDEVNNELALLLGWTREPWIEKYDKWRHDELEPEQWLLSPPNWAGSIDAQAGLLGDGWDMAVSNTADGSFASIWKRDAEGDMTAAFNSPLMHAEPLARLMAIILTMEGDE